MSNRILKPVLHIYRRYGFQETVPDKLFESGEIGEHPDQMTEVIVWYYTNAGFSICVCPLLEFSGRFCMDIVCQCTATGGDYLHLGIITPVFNQARFRCIGNGICHFLCSSHAFIDIVKKFVIA